MKPKRRISWDFHVYIVILVYFLISIFYVGRKDILEKHTKIETFTDSYDNTRTCNSSMSLKLETENLKIILI